MRTMRPCCCCRARSLWQVRTLRSELVREVETGDMGGVGAGEGIEGGLEETVDQEAAVDAEEEGGGDCGAGPERRGKV